MAGVGHPNGHSVYYINSCASLFLTPTVVTGHSTHIFTGITVFIFTGITPLLRYTITIWLVRHHQKNNRTKGKLWNTHADFFPKLSFTTYNLQGIMFKFLKKKKIFKCLDQGWALNDTHYHWSYCWCSCLPVCLKQNRFLLLLLFL